MISVNNNKEVMFMIIKDQILKIKITAKNIRYYRSLGYQCRPLDVISVPLQDLSAGSHCEVTIKCDNCGKLFTRPYYRYFNCHDEILGDLCRSCCSKKTKRTTREKYNYDHISQIPEIKNKKVETFRSNFGFDYILQVPYYQENLKKKSKELYGNEFYSKTPEFIERFITTNRERRGVDYPSQSPEVQNKIRKSFEKNKNNTWTSKQQLDLYEKIKELYGESYCQLNFAESHLSLDIMLNINDCKIDIEYDGWYWHRDTELKDRKRDEFLKSRKYKILRIKSGKLLPSNKDLILHINKLINSNCQYTEIILPDWEKHNT